jgi:hypothetical protein
LTVAVLPPPARQVTATDQARASRTIRGAFHVHTKRSDGTGDRADVARAARRAGLQFVIITDHGDGVRPPDPPAYVDGVLCLDGVEISTDGGHYIALGASPSPYPLGGDSSAVVEDVARLGGFGIAAHPISPRAELAWSDWTLPIDGIEWLNADSEWRDESRWHMTRALAGYFMRPSAALARLLDRPEPSLARWDALASRRRIVGIAGHDAHGGVGGRIEEGDNRRTLPIPSYRASFGMFSTRIELDRPLSGNAGADGAALLATLKAGRFFTEIDAMATGSTLDFTGRTIGGTVTQGRVLPGAGTATFTARAATPPDAIIVALRNGSEIARSPGGTLDFQSQEMGAFRVEVRLPDAAGTPPVPWLVSNPIFRLAEAPPETPRDHAIVLALPVRGWRIEKGEGSEGTVHTTGSGEVEFQYRLRPGPRVSQFVALATDLPPDLPAFDAVSFGVRSNAPQRVSAQLRFAGDGGGRWRKSVYVDSTAKIVSVAVNDLRRADGPPGRPDPRRATSLLFVIDLTNARPGDGGSITLNAVSLGQ